MNGLLNIHPKVAGGGLAGALSLILLSVASHWFKVTPEVSAATGVILTFVGAYLAPLAKREAATLVGTAPAAPAPADAPK